MKCTTLLKKCFLPQLWAASTLVKAGKQFGYWIEDMQKDSNDPDTLTIVLMPHFLGKNIILLSGKAEEWSTETNMAVDILLLYKGDNIYCPTDVGTYISFKPLFSFFFYLVRKLLELVKEIKNEIYIKFISIILTVFNYLLLVKKIQFTIAHN